MNHDRIDILKCFEDNNMFDVELSIDTEIGEVLIIVNMSIIALKDDIPVEYSIYALPDNVLQKLYKELCHENQY